jgi:single-strand DNA-binding protein
MSDVNHIILIGRLTRDAELKYTSGGTSVCKFSLAIGKRIKKNESWVDEVSFFDVVLFGKTGEAINQYLVKGKQVAIEGELRQDRWEQDGQNRSKVEVMAHNVQLLGGGQPAQVGTGQIAPTREERRPAPPQQDADDQPFYDYIPF